MRDAIDSVQPFGVHAQRAAGTAAAHVTFVGRSEQSAKATRARGTHMSVPNESHMRSGAAEQLATGVKRHSPGRQTRSAYQTHSIVDVGHCARVAFTKLIGAQAPFGVVAVIVQEQSSVGHVEGVAYVPQGFERHTPIGKYWQRGIAVHSSALNVRHGRSKHPDTVVAPSVLFNHAQRPIPPR